MKIRLLAPSLMALMGKWNWWAPLPLRRLHERLRLSENVGPLTRAEPDLWNPTL
jgi:hypothetical protein